MMEVLEQPIDVSLHKRVYLKATINRADLQFYYAIAPNDWQAIGVIQDASILSDDYVQTGSNRYRPAFTGAFVGICCQDLTGNGHYADFDWFEYEEIY